MKHDGRQRPLAPRDRRHDAPDRLVPASSRRGELLVTDYGGRLLPPRARARRPKQAAPFPTRLSETGLFASTPEHRPASGGDPLLGECAGLERRRGGRAIPGRPGRREGGLRRRAELELPRRHRPGPDALDRAGARQSRPRASASRRACCSASRGSGPATPTAGTPIRPTRRSWRKGGEEARLPPAVRGRARAELAVPQPVPSAWRATAARRTSCSASPGRS